LLDVLAALGQLEDRQLVLGKIMAEGILHHPLQRPGYLHASLLPGDPWPSGMPRAAAAVADLEAVFDAVQQDLQVDLSNKKDVVQRDEESLAVQGGWQQVVLVRDGTVYQHVFNEFLYAGQLLLELVTRYAQDLPKGSLEISTIARKANGASC
jgi:hypothetical protein